MHPQAKHEHDPYHSERHPPSPTGYIRVAAQYTCIYTTTNSAILQTSPAALLEPQLDHSPITHCLNSFMIDLCMLLQKSSTDDRPFCNTTGAE